MYAAGDLPQPPSKHAGLAHDVTRLVMLLASHVLHSFSARAAEFELSPPQIKVLLALDAAEEAPMRAVATRLEYDSSNLTGVVDRLEGRGLILRQPDPTDRRVKAIVLTEEGRAVRDAFWRKFVSDARALGQLNSSQLEQLRELLRIATGTD